MESESKSRLLKGHEVAQILNINRRCLPHDAARGYQSRQIWKVCPRFRERFAGIHQQA